MPPDPGHPQPGWVTETLHSAWPAQDIFLMSARTAFQAVTSYVNHDLLEPCLKGDPRETQGRVKGGVYTVYSLPRPWPMIGAKRSSQQMGNHNSAATQHRWNEGKKTLIRKRAGILIAPLHGGHSSRGTLICSKLRAANPETRRPQYRGCLWQIMA